MARAARDARRGQPERATRTRRSAAILSSEEIARDVEEADRSALSDRPQSERYPERSMPIAGTQPRPEMWATKKDAPPEGEEYQAALERYELFSHARERFLRSYRYNTARAYWGDLDDIFFWCEHRQLDIFDLTDREMNQYKGLLRRRKYSENTIRRREVTYRLFRKVVDA